MILFQMIGTLISMTPTVHLLKFIRQTDVYLLFYILIDLNMNDFKTYYLTNVSQCKSGNELNTINVYTFDERTFITMYLLASPVPRND